MKKIIGFNLMVDIFRVEKNFLEKKFLLSLISKLVQLTKTQPVGRPIIKKISSYKYPFVGYSLIQIIQESHVALHTWPEYNYLSLDIFSCKKINKEKILSFLKASLNKGIKLRIKFYQRIAEI
ncbi:S-adenosylmethionine decarboxylase proenzyme [bacterium HR35]|nr:S-adenosylmethionine decarboxylase proenzyme [bacterium HR35]